MFLKSHLNVPLFYVKNNVTVFFKDQVSRGDKLLAVKLLAVELLAIKLLAVKLLAVKSLTVKL